MPTACGRQERHHPAQNAGWKWTWTSRYAASRDASPTRASAGNRRRRTSQVLQPLVRLRASTRRHVRGYGFGMGTVVRDTIRRQEAAAAQHHQAPPEEHPLRGAEASEDYPAQTVKPWKVPGNRPSREEHSGAFLTRLLSRRSPNRNRPGRSDLGFPRVTPILLSSRRLRSTPR